MTDFTQIERTLKGRTTEALAVLIFERGLYRVAKVGIEELLREIKVIPKDQYAKLGLEISLRSMPDLLVTDTDMSVAYQVEIKFRGDFSGITRGSLADTIDEQRKLWPNTYVLLMLGSCGWNKNAKFFQDYVRVIPPTFNTMELREKVYDIRVWEKLSVVGDVFTGLKKSDFAVDILVPLLRTLNEAKENSDV